MRGALLVAAVLGVLALVSIPGTTAAFTDAPTAKSGTFAGATLHAPTGLTCRAGSFNNYVDITWTPASTATPHWYSITDGRTTAFLGEAKAGVKTARVQAGDGVPDTDDGYLTVRVRPVAGDNWISADVATIRVHRTFDMFTFSHKITCA